MNTKRKLAESLAAYEAFSHVNLETLVQIIEIPPEANMGDFAFPCFSLAKAFKKSPVDIASELAGQINIDYIQQIEAKGAYLNFFLDPYLFAKEIISTILDKKVAFASSDLGNAQLITMDYSSPNIAKSLHVGHLRSTVIGRSLNKILTYIGYKTVSINHLGDWGTQFGKLIVAYHLWSSKDLVTAKGIEELNRIYVKFGQEAANNPALEEEAREWFVKLENGDTEALDIWQWFKDISLEMIEDTYKLFNLTMDYYTGESFYNDKMEAVVLLLEEKKLLEMSDGAQLVDLEAYDMPPALIIRSDGGTLYMTRDLATAIYRKNEFDFSKSIYITDAGQSLHFRQLFKVLELMDYPWAKDLIHVPFGLYLDESGKKFSTRAGTGVEMDRLLSESIERTLAIINEKNPALDNKEDVAKQVGVGALIFYDLYNSRMKDITFSWERILTFEGESGPYLQYTYARAMTVLEKATSFSLDFIDYHHITDIYSFEITKLLASFPERIIEAGERLEPYIVARHSIAIAQAFNRFYHERPILQAPEAVKLARLALTQATVYALKIGMDLLGMETPETM